MKNLEKNLEFKVNEIEKIKNKIDEAIREIINKEGFEGYGEDLHKYYKEFNEHYIKYTNSPLDRTHQEIRFIYSKILREYRRIKKLK